MFASEILSSWLWRKSSYRFTVWRFSYRKGLGLVVCFHTNKHFVTWTCWCVWYIKRCVAAHCTTIINYRRVYFSSIFLLTDYRSVQKAWLPAVTTIARANGLVSSTRFHWQGTKDTGRWERQPFLRTPTRPPPRRKRGDLTVPGNEDSRQLEFSSSKASSLANLCSSSPHFWSLFHAYSDWQLLGKQYPLAAGQNAYSNLTVLCNRRQLSALSDELLMIPSVISQD